MKNNKIPLICVVGPTASGKTALSIELAKTFNGEIISADSMQIYKGMDIATAKPTKEEQDGVKHHLLDFLEIDKPFSVAQYCDLANEIVCDINNRRKIPVLVGGTGLYVDSFINGISFADADGDEKLREYLRKEAELYGIDYLLDKLRKVDPISADKLTQTRNLKRIIRAIEVFETTGITISEHNEKSHTNSSPYNVVKIGLTATDRQYLYDRINRRVDLMVENGLIEEARGFTEVTHSVTSAKAIGHKELIPFLNGEAELQNCIENLKMQTRRYAKRQLTWFRRDEEIHWFNINILTKEELINSAVNLVKKELFDEKQ